MGLLETEGEALDWNDPRAAEARKYVLEHGVAQFLSLYSNYKDEVSKPFLWGEEVEYCLVKLDEQNKRAALWLKVSDGNPEDPLKKLNDEEQVQKALGKGGDLAGLWRPEYGAYMIEGTPTKPYTHDLISIASTQDNLDRRHAMLKKVLPPDVAILTLGNFPRMGVLDSRGRSDFTYPPGLEVRGPVAKSLFVPDACTNQGHPRFSTLTKNIRKRRGKKVCIRIPLFVDERTAVDPLFNIDANAQNQYIQQAQQGGDDDDDDDDAGDASAGAAPPAKRPRTEPDGAAAAGDTATADALGDTQVTPTMYYFSQYFGGKGKEEAKAKEARVAAEKRERTAVASHPSIYMDCMAFGMGCNCLQTTFQANSIDEARHVYDQLAVLCPVMLALSASTPIHKGLLAEIDVRWMVISASVDCRREEEVPRIMKSRYDSVSTYISQRPSDEYFSAMNDMKLVLDQDVYQRLRKNGIDHRLSRHVSHLFIRDPLVIFTGRLQQLHDDKFSDHFENIQSTNWQSMRFKPPPPRDAGTEIGWRVEFRVFDIQLSNFENAAYATFTILLARAITKFDLDFYMPLTKVDDNTARAHRRDAVLSRSFIMKRGMGKKFDVFADPDQLEYVEMTCEEIMNGCEHFEGLIPIVERYLDLARESECNGKPEAVQQAWDRARRRIGAYLELLRRRASGKVKTVARFWRDFVTSHPTYQKDSKVTPEIAYDMCKLANDVIEGRCFPPDLLPKEIVDMAA
eukprot:TRINITY_DN46928_c0_g1_i1.p1 TRINITY_DN46928_c0_g1~~TRINITY_DN46928_c0_g1_i1.p1  ORF type:complete len:739 (+),score=272.16 TRINITY_DN46928_c0_g1_i1:90-2306(+)